MKPLVTIVTPTTGNPCIARAPYATGKERFNGHRIYGASVFLGDGDYFCFLDEDNWFDADHVESLVETAGRGCSWAFSLRKIVDLDGNFVCNDDCESLGKWPSIGGYYLVDVGCFFLPRPFAVESCPVWFRKGLGSGTLPADRMLTAVLRQHAANFETTGRYTLNYRVGNTAFSARKEFFLRGNEEMLRKLGGKLPWREPADTPSPTPARMIHGQRRSPGGSGVTSG